MMYKSQIQKSDPYDWFCGPESHMFKYKIVILNCNSISQYYCFYCIFDQINAALVTIRDFF